MPTAALKPPLQKRSRETLARLLQATEGILREKSFDEATIAEICGRAGLTVGAFYARFADKDALLYFLAKQLLDEGPRPIAAHWKRSSNTPLATLVRSAIADAVGIYRKRRGLMRALVLRSHSDRKLRSVLQRANQRNLQWFLNLLLEQKQRIGRHNPERAVEFALLLLVSAIREVVVFREFWPGGERFDDEELVRELGTAFLAYTQISGD